LPEFHQEKANEIERSHRRRSDSLCRKRLPRAGAGQMNPRVEVFFNSSVAGTLIDLN